MSRALASQAETASGFFIPDLCEARQVFILVLLSELLVIVYTLAASSLQLFDWELLGKSSLIVLWVVLLSAAVLCRLRAALHRFAVPVASTLALLCVLTVTTITSLLAQSQVPEYRAEGAAWVLRNLLVALVCGSIALRYFFLQHQLRLTERGELLARLESLRTRIRPHFLFNTLNSIASLIDIDPAKAETAVENLADLFRTSLADEDRPTTVDDEIRSCQLYLEIEHLRLGDRLEVHWRVDDALRCVPMPSLMLQPLVENAVYHGIAQLPDGGCISITVADVGGDLQVVMENPLPEAGSTAHGHNMALSNVQQRLQGMFGGRGRLSAGPSADGFRVELSYPLDQAAQPGVLL